MWSRCMNKIRTVVISSTDSDVDLYNMTLLCFNMIQRQAWKDQDGGFRIKAQWTEPDESYTCYTNGIIDFSCQSTKSDDYHVLIKQEATE